MESGSDRPGMPAPGGADGAVPEGGADVRAELEPPPHARPANGDDAAEAGRSAGATADAPVAAAPSGGTPADGSADGPAGGPSTTGEPAAVAPVEEDVSGVDGMDTTSMAAVDVPDRLPPFTDPPRSRFPELRRHLRFWEVAPETVAPRPVAPDRPVGDQRPIWEWSDEPGVDAVADGTQPVPTADPARPLALAAPARFGTLAELRAESRDLRRQIQAMQFDLGGLHVEMARAASVDHALLEARALDLVAAGDRLVTVERAIEARRRGDDPSWATLVPCASCGAPRPHDASFCPYCGSSVGPSRNGRTG